MPRPPSARRGNLACEAPNASGTGVASSHLRKGMRALHVMLRSAILQWPRLCDGSVQTELLMTNGVVTEPRQRMVLQRTCNGGIIDGGHENWRN